MNPFLRKLGYSPDDRVVIVHADDVGMCQASLAAFTDLVEFGLVSSGSTMVPCSWFPSVVDFCRANPEVDMGVHVTLTCEWDAYRWRPISTRDRASGLFDDEGYFPRTSLQVWEKADVDAAIAEAQAQIDVVQGAGIDATHAEDHMAALSHPRLLPRFADLLLELGIPYRGSRPPAPQPDDGEWQIVTRRELLRIEAAGFPLFDFGGDLPLDDPDDQMGCARRILDHLPRGGLSVIVMHPAKDTPELRAIAPDWPSRVANYETFMKGELRQFVHDAGIHIVNFRALRAQIHDGGTGSRYPFVAAQQTKRRHMPRRIDKAGWDFTKPWYHGSPKALDVLRAGSTITQDRELARVFSHKPTLVSVDDAGETRQIKHDGHELGFLYRVAEEITSEDVTPHPRSAIEFGKEWLTGRALRLTLIEPTQPVREEMLTVEEIEALRQRRSRPDGSF